MKPRIRFIANFTPSEFAHRSSLTYSFPNYEEEAQILSKYARFSWIIVLVVVRKQDLIEERSVCFHIIEILARVVHSEFHEMATDDPLLIDFFDEVRVEHHCLSFLVGVHTANHIL